MKLTFRFPYWLAVTVLAIEATLRVLTSDYVGAGIWAAGALILAYAWWQESRHRDTADAVLALMADQPTVAEAKAQALEEAAADPDFTAWLESRENKIPAARAWLQHRAELIRDGE